MTGAKGIIFFKKDALLYACEVAAIGRQLSSLRTVSCVPVRSEQRYCARKRRGDSGCPNSKKALAGMSWREEFRDDRSASGFSGRLAG